MRILSVFMAVAALAAGIGAGFAGWAQWLERTDLARLETDFPWVAASDRARGDRLCIAARPCDAGPLKEVSSDIWRSAPGSWRPLLYGAYRAARTDDRAAAIRLAQAALDTEGRLPLAHAILADAYLQQADHAKALFHLERLVVLGGGDIDVTGAIASLAASPQGLTVLERRLAEEPAWGPGVIARLNESTLDPMTLLRLNRAAPDAQTGFVQKILTEQGPQQALLSWFSFLPPEQLSGFSWPFDPEFKAIPAPGPFTWSYDRERVNFEKGGGLFALYLGSGAATVASQLMVLGPGAYRLESTLSAEGTRDGGRFAWVLACYPNGKEIARLDIRGEIAPGTVLTAPFATPAAECPAQTLSLRTAPGDFPIKMRLTATSVRIRAQSEQAER